MRAEIPLPNGTNGRDAQGRFLPGNKGGPGNPFARHAAALRRAFYDAISEKDLQAIAKKLISLAKGGDLAAIKLVLLWSLGTPPEAILPDVVDLPAAAGDEENTTEFRGISTAADPLPEASVDYETRRRAALRQLVPLVLAAKAAEALPAATRTPEAPDSYPFL